jgi:hypothetical protein
LRGWVVTNKAAAKNNGLLGDAIIAWFKPLDETFDGLNYTNETYIMVVNALTDPTGTAADCMQQIRLNFLDTPATSSVLMLDPLIGKVTTNALPIVNTRRQLAVDLNGGDAILFKFNTGAPFVGHVVPAAARLAAARNSNQTTLTLQGTIGARYQIQSSPSLSAANWNTLTNFFLPATPYAFSDTTAPNAPARFYRAVGVP